MPSFPSTTSSKAVYVHGGYPALGARVLLANDTCARWLHVVNLHKPRLAKAKTFTIKPKWVWPLGQAEAAAAADDDGEEPSDADGAVMGDGGGAGMAEVVE